MKKNEELWKDVQNAIKRERLLNVSGTGAFGKIGTYMKKFIYLASLAGIGLFFNACMSGYIATEPAYMTYSRPPRPDNLSIWIDGNWYWNRQTHVYVQKTGYWEAPRQGRTYMSGHWQTTPRGKTWSKGYWQSESRQKKNNGR
jgi:hypothetical protein